MVDGSWRVFLIDDHPLVRMWLAQLLEQQRDLVVCGEAGDAHVALRELAPAMPDLLIVDVSLPDYSGLELIKQAKRIKPSMRVMVFSMHDEKTYAERAIRAGADGYVMKRATAEELVAAIYAVLRGKRSVSQNIRKAFADKFGEGCFPPPGPAVEMLSDRELEIFEMIGTGADTRAVSRALDISIKTVQAHCANIKLKMRLSNATELLREALRWNEFGRGNEAHGSTNSD